MNPDKSKQPRGITCHWLDPRVSRCDIHSSCVALLNCFHTVARRTVACGSSSGTDIEPLQSASEGQEDVNTSMQCGERMSAYCARLYISDSATGRPRVTQAGTGHLRTVGR